MFFYEFPEIKGEQELPIYLLTVGINEWQYHVINQEGDKFDRILYCTKGQGTLVLDNTKHIIEPHMGFFIPAKCPFEYYSNGAVWDTHWVVFGGYACNQLLSQFGFTKPFVVKMKDTKYLDYCIRKMHEAISADNEFGNFRASGYVYDFLIEFYRICSKNGKGEQANPIITKALDYIHLHYKEQFSLDEVSEECGVTKQHLCRLFQSHLQCRPMEYISRYRLKHAKQLLVHTNLPIDQIATETGFGSDSYFCRVFKKYEGMTASQFKKN